MLLERGDHRGRGPTAARPFVRCAGRGSGDVARAGDTLLRPGGGPGFDRVDSSSCRGDHAHARRPSVLSGVEVQSPDRPRQAARESTTWGRLSSSSRPGTWADRGPRDLLFDGQSFEVLSGRRIYTPTPTGCTFSRPSPPAWHGHGASRGAREGASLRPRSVLHAEPLGVPARAGESSLEDVACLTSISRWADAQSLARISRAHAAHPQHTNYRRDERHANGAPGTGRVAGHGARHSPKSGDGRPMPAPWS